MRFRLILLAAFTLLLAACGDDEPSFPGFDNDLPGVPGDDVTLDDETFDIGGMPGMPSQVCWDLTMAMGRAVALGTPGTDPLEMMASFEDVASEVPPNVAADLMIIVNAFREYGEILADAGIQFGDPATFQGQAASDALAQGAAALDASGYHEAADRIGDYLEEICS